MRTPVALAITMRTGSWMLGQLEYVTRGLHVQADAARIALLRGALPRARYESFLARVFAFEAPVEARWHTISGLERVIDITSRTRARFLAADLVALGVPLPDTAPAPFVGIEQALGWMYVVERGRRMNGLLHRHLQRRLPEELAIAGNFLLLSSPSGIRWQQFGAALDRYAHNSVIADQILNAATRAFRAIRATRADTDETEATALAAVPAPS